MKKIILIAGAIAAATPFPISAFERDMLNLNTPSGLEARNAVIEIQHRFYGTVGDDPAGTILGMTEGANVHLGFRYCLGRRLEFKSALTLFQKEYTMAASHTSHFAKLVRAEVKVEFFSYRLPEMEGRRRNFFYSVAAEGEPILNVISPALVVGYDGYEERVGPASAPPPASTARACSSTSP